MSDKKIPITETDLQSDPLTRTYRIPKSLLHHLEDVHDEMKRAMRDQDKIVFEYQVLVAALSLGLQDWYENGINSKVYLEAEKLVDLKNR